MERQEHCPHSTRRKAVDKLSTSSTQRGSASLISPPGDKPSGGVQAQPDGMEADAGSLPPKFAARAARNHRR
jgi:hypothetical protein